MKEKVTYKRWFIILNFLFVFFFIFNSTLITQTRRAFLVGINDYEPKEPVKKTLCRKEWKNLHGCINDVNAMKGILMTRFYFEPENIHVLTDNQASRGNILSGIETHLIKDAVSGDVCVFYFAGHGSRVKNSMSNEPDKKDESLVPADWHEGVGDIRDKELKKLFNRILDKKAYLTVIVDACHSGSISRGVPAPRRFRALPENLCDVADPPDNEKEPAERGALIISAAYDYQEAVEKEFENNKHFGLFTWALVKVLRNIPFEESAGNILLKVNALIQSEGIKQMVKMQDPNLETLLQLRNKPLFGPKPARDTGITAAVVEIMGKRVKLLAGYAAGIRKNCELKKIEKKGRKPAVRVRVTRVYGLNLCQAELIRGNAAEINEGDLFEIDRWAAPREGRMRVWIPASSFSHKDLLAFSREAAHLKDSGYIRWVNDPTEISPTHLMYWDNTRSSWLLETVDGSIVELGLRPKFNAILKKILLNLHARKEKPCFFLQLPLSAESQKLIAPEMESYNNAIKKMPSGRDAHYIMAGRFVEDEIAYAWVLPNSVREEGKGFALPVRTRWIAPGKTGNENRKAVVELRNILLRLVKVRAWLQLFSPPDKGDFPYRLALKHVKTGEIKTSGPLMEGEEYGLILRAYKEKPGNEIYGRYVYVFSINSRGRGTLLFPRSHRGSSGNYFPAHEEFQREIPLRDGPLFKIDPPFGVDTYFLLTTEEPIVNPEVLDFEGVRGPPPAGNTYTPLERLLYGLGSSFKGSPPPTYTNWSIQRLPILSVPRNIFFPLP